MSLPESSKSYTGSCSTSRTLDSIRIIGAAASLIEEKGQLSMRALAKALNVDPMAVYHYFSNKDELINAVAESLFSQVEAVVPLMRCEIDWQARLRLLAGAYLNMAQNAPALTSTLARQLAPEAEISIASRFETLFRLAIDGSGVPEQKVRVCMCVLVDCIHGYSLSTEGTRSQWDAEFDVLLVAFEMMS